MKTLLLMATLGLANLSAEAPRDANDVQAEKIQEDMLSALVQSAMKDWRSVGLYKASSTGDQTLVTTLFGTCPPKLDPLSPNELKLHQTNPNYKSGNIFTVRIEFGAVFKGDGDALIHSAQFSGRELSLICENYQMFRMSASNLFRERNDSKLEFTLKDLIAVCNALKEENNKQNKSEMATPMKPYNQF